MHAVDSKYRKQWVEMLPVAIMGQLYELSSTVKLVTISGGNPAIPSDMPQLVDMLHACGHEVALETQGSIFKSWFDDLDYLILSPKMPSSGHTVDHDVLEKCLGYRNVHVKIVIDTLEDYHCAVKLYLRHMKGQTLWVQPCNTAPQGEADILDLCNKYRILCNLILYNENCSEWRVLPQLHTLAWGNNKGR